MRSQICAVPGCKSSDALRPQISLFRFPLLQSTELACLWFRECQIPPHLRTQFLDGKLRVCSKHFTPECMMQTVGGYRKVRPTAVPTRFPWTRRSPSKSAPPPQVTLLARRRRFAKVLHPLGTPCRFPLSPKRAQTSLRERVRAAQWRPSWRPFHSWQPSDSWQASDPWESETSSDQEHTPLPRILESSFVQPDLDEMPVEVEEDFDKAAADSQAPSTLEIVDETGQVWNINCGGTEDAPRSLPARPPVEVEEDFDQAAADSQAPSTLEIVDGTDQVWNINCGGTEDAPRSLPARPPVEVEEDFDQAAADSQAPGNLCINKETEDSEVAAAQSPPMTQSRIISGGVQSPTEFATVQASALPDGPDASPCRSQEIRRRGRIPISRAALIRQRRTLQQRLRSQDRKLEDLQQTLKRLKEQAKEHDKLIDELGPGLGGLIQRTLEGNKGRKYSLEERQYAMAIYYYSPRAYKFLRLKLNLPNPRTIRAWLAKLDGKPGFLETALKALKLFAQDMARPLIVNLVIDEIILRHDLTLLKDGELFGFVDLGNGVFERTDSPNQSEEMCQMEGDHVPPCSPDHLVAEGSEMVEDVQGLEEQPATLPASSFRNQIGRKGRGTGSPWKKKLVPPRKGIPAEKKEQLAKNATVILAVGVNANFKIPVYYALTRGLDVDTRVEILSTVIKQVSELGVEVAGVTADGAHLCVFQKLGVNIEEIVKGSTDPVHCSFPNPDPAAKNTRIFAIFDACHLLKLMRNLLGQKKELLWNGKRVSWKFVEHLHNFQKVHGMRHANRLSERHIDFEPNIMKVRFAAQLLSTSVAAALDFGRLSGYEGFDGSTVTASWIQLVNDLFDVLNCRNFQGKGLKAPWTRKNFFEIEKVLDRARYMLLDLENVEEQKPVLCTKKKAVIVGFLLTSASMKGIFNRYILEDHPAEMTFLLTFKFSQDHLETFFGTIRAASGSNNNPSPYMFRCILRKCLFGRIQDITRGNCDPRISKGVADLLGVSEEASGGVSLREEAIDDAETDLLFADDEDEEFGDPGDTFDHDYIRELEALPEFSVNAVEYVAGYCVRHAMKTISCQMCRHALMSIQKNGSRFTLVRLRDRGGLIEPSRAVLRLCVAAERAVLHSLPGNIPKPSVTVDKIFALLQETAAPVMFFHHPPLHIDASERTAFVQHMRSSHAPGDMCNARILVRTVARKYIQVRINHCVRLFLGKIKKDVRHKATRKAIHYGC